MFAYHTPTRMKGTVIVQGLKSWASALHPQLPLSRRESQRLLNALTASFRRHLDEAHPPHGSPGDARPQLATPADDRARPERSHGLHSSSAAFADHHLASVLTNPLLSRAQKAEQPEFRKKSGEAQKSEAAKKATAALKAEAEAVEAELQGNPTTSPIDLLEEYQEKGKATVLVATACLETFMKSLQGLSNDQQRRKIPDISAGRRTLLWIWKNKVYEDEQFIENKRLSEIVVSLVIKEGFEQYLWNWLDLDMRVDGEESLRAATKGVQRTVAARKQRHHAFRWKGVIIRQIVAAKIETSDSFDAAIAAYLRAIKHPDARSIPLAGAASALQRRLLNDDQKRFATHAADYNRLIEATTSPEQRAHDAPTSQYIAAWLHLLHPHAPSADAAVLFFRRLLDPANTNVNWQAQRTHVLEPQNNAQRHWHHRLFIHTIVRLEDQNMRQDAAWVRSQCEQAFPEFAKYLQANVRTEREARARAERQWGSKRQSRRQEKENPKPVRESDDPENMPGTSFAV